jgi:uncharacterized protein (TIGR02266 family)
MPARRAQAPVAESERRDSARVVLEVEVGLETDHNFYTGLTRDISSGGLFVATHLIRPVGERVGVRFTLPGRRAPIALETEVRWVRDGRTMRTDCPDGMGLRFLELPADARAAVAAFLEQRDSLYYDDE